MRNLNKFELRHWHCDRERDRAYITNGHFILRVDKHRARGLRVEGWPMQHSDRHEAMIAEYDALLDAAVPIRLAGSPRVEKLMRQWPVPRGHIYVSLTIGEHTAPFSLEYLVALDKAGFIPSHIVTPPGEHTDGFSGLVFGSSRGNTARAMLMAGRASGMSAVKIAGVVTY